METENIQLKTLFIATALVVVLEVVASALPASGLYKLPMIGFVRLVDIACLLITVFLVEKNLSCIGLHRAGIFSALKRGALWSIGFGVLAAIGALVLLSFGIQPLNLIKMRLPADNLSLALYFLVGGIIGPVAEEIFFRGIVFRFFRRWGFLFSVIFSTLIFASMHASAVPLPQLVGGLLFAVSFEIEKNLLVPTAIHILGNLAIFSFSVLSI